MASELDTPPNRYNLPFTTLRKKQRYQRYHSENAKIAISADPTEEQHSFQLTNVDLWSNKTIDTDCLIFIKFFNYR